MVNFRIFLNLIFIIFIVQCNNINSSFDIDKTPSADSGFVGGNPLLGDLRSDRGRKMKEAKDNASNSSSKATDSKAAEASSAASDAQANLGTPSVDLIIENPEAEKWKQYTIRDGVQYFIEANGDGRTEFGLPAHCLNDRQRELFVAELKAFNDWLSSKSQPSSRTGTLNGTLPFPVQNPMLAAFAASVNPTESSTPPVVDPDLPNADNTVGFGDGIIGNQTTTEEENKIKAKPGFLGKTKKFVVKNPLLVLVASTITVGATAYAASDKVRKKVHETINDIKTSASNFKTRVINYWYYLKNRPVRVKDAVGLGLGLTALGFGVKYANQANNKWNITGKIKEDWQKLNFLQKLVAFAAPLVAVYLAKEVARDAKIIYEKTGNNKPSSRDYEIQTRKRSNSI